MLDNRVPDCEHCGGAIYYVTALRDEYIMGHGALWHHEGTCSVCKKITPFTELISIPEIFEDDIASFYDSEGKPR